MRARLLFVMIASGCAVSAATACSSPDVALEAEAKRATQASSVTVSMLDKSGKELGSCSGTLVAMVSGLRSAMYWTMAGPSVSTLPSSSCKAGT